MVVSMAGACKNKSFLDGFSNRQRFEDFNFKTMEGMGEMSTLNSDNYIEVFKEGKMVKLKVFSKIGEVGIQHIEEFEKVGNYYYRYYEDNDDNPDMLVATTTFIRENDIIIYDIATNRGKPYYSDVKQIIPDKNEIVEYHFSDFLIETTPQIDFIKLLDHQALFRVTTQHLSCKKDRIVVTGKIKNYRDGIEDSYTSYYEGFPSAKNINTYWNLYKYYLGKDIAHEF